MFEQAGVDPTAAVVIEDGLLPCAWAEATGATVIRVDRTHTTMADGVVPDFASAARLVLERG